MRGHIRPRGKGKWILGFDVGRNPSTGKRQQRWHTVIGTRKDAERELRTLLQTVETGAYIQPSNLTFGSFLIRWLADVKSRTAPRTHEGYDWLCTRHIIPALGSVDLSKLQPSHLQAHYAKALKQGRLDGSGGLSPRSVIHQHRVIHEALQDAVKWGVLPRNVAQAVEPPKAPRHEMRTLQANGVQQLLSALEASWAYEPVFLAVHTGMRRSELLGLRWGDVDLDMATVSVQRALHHLRDGSLVFTQPKSQKGVRLVALTPSAVVTLRNHRRRQEQQAALLGTSTSSDGLVFCHHDGSPLLPSSLTHAYLRAARSVSIYGVRLHDLRHTHASLMLRQGVHPKIVSERLGHSTVGITLDLYSHVAPGLQEAAANRFEEGLVVEHFEPAQGKIMRSLLKCLQNVCRPEGSRSLGRSAWPRFVSEIWYARWDSNPRPSVPKTDALIH